MTIPITIWGKLDPDDHYLCSIDGDILSTKFGRTKPIKPTPDSTGYLCFSYYKDGIKTTMKVHRFVAMIFLSDKSDQGLEVLHYDGNPLNNSLENLRWGTRKENCADAIRHGTLGEARGERHGMSKLTEDDVMQIRDLRALGLTQREIGYLFGVNQSQINRILRGKRWQHPLLHPERGEDIAA